MDVCCNPSECCRCAGIRKGSQRVLFYWPIWSMKAKMKILKKQSTRNALQIIEKHNCFEKASNDLFNLTTAEKQDGTVLTCDPPDEDFWHCRITSSTNVGTSPLLPFLAYHEKSMWERAQGLLPFLSTSRGHGFCISTQQKILGMFLSEKIHRRFARYAKGTLPSASHDTKHLYVLRIT